jgi:peptidoglycan/xylan/chitin deacetylase (PgdA/CDA1 family)
MYHEIIKKDDFDINNHSQIVVNQGYQDVLPKPLFVFLEEFEAQMQYLYENGYHTLKLQEVVDFFYNGKPLPEKSLLLTFDDLYQSVLRYAYPILKRYQFHAVGFVVLDWLFDETKSYSNTQSICLSKEEIETMRDVFEYANHTNSLHTRKDGLTTLQTVDEATFCEDIGACEDYVDTKKVFAYPFGIFTEEVVQYLKKMGFLLAFTTDGGQNDQETNPLRLRRNGVFLDFGLNKFKEIFNREESL